MSKANPFIPASLDNPDLARDMRALANRLQDQRSRYANECARNPLAALTSIEIAFDGLARDLRRLADHCQPVEDPEPTAATAWIGGRVVTLRTRPDGIVSTAPGVSDALGFPTAIDAGGRVLGALLNAEPGPNWKPPVYGDPDDSAGV